MSKADTTFVKGMSILEQIARSDNARGVTELSEALGLTKSNVHRLLQTLIACGLVQRDEGSGRYVATLKIWELGHEVWLRSQLKTVTSPIVEELARRTREMVNVAIIDGDDFLFFEQVGNPTAYPFRMFWPIGGRMHCWQILPGGKNLTAIQIAYLSILPDEKIQTILRMLRGHFGNSAKALENISRRIQFARRRGYALNRGEWNEDMRGAASVFFHKDGRPAGILGLNGPAQRVDTATVERWGNLAKHAAESISYEIGYRKPHELQSPNARLR
jgi:DNA-binding IclR family transcriptional regulator